MRKVLIGSILAVALSGAALTAMGGMSWLDAKGFRGQQHLVAARIDGYWKARIEGDMERMGSYLHPLQESIPEPGMLVTEGFELHGVAIEGDQAMAKLTIKSRLKHPVLSSRGRTLELDSLWVKYEGQWYLAPSPNNIYESIQAYQGKWTPPTAKTPSAPVDNATSVQ